MRVFWLLTALCAGCAPPAPGANEPIAISTEDAQSDIAKVLDDWHLAAAASDEERYFAHFADDAVFMGTDATERWDKAAFRAYAHPHFAKGKGWKFEPTRRSIMVEGTLAWFDEDLATPNLGPARGSGVLREEPDGTWRIVHYNLAITVPNERFDAVRGVLEDRMEGITGAVVLTGAPPEMEVPTWRLRAHFCKDTKTRHDAVLVGAADEELGGSPLANVVVRLPLGAAAGQAPEPESSVTIVQRDCLFQPRMTGLMVEQEFEIENRDPIMHNVNAGLGSKVLFNTAQPPGADPIRDAFHTPGLVLLKDSVHPWKRAFVWVSDHPHFAVTDTSGRFDLGKVPDGTYSVEAWHSQFGLKTARIAVKKGKSRVLRFEFTGRELPPPENPTELQEVFTK